MTIKEALYQRCNQQIEEKMALAQHGMNEAQNSANNETKSSAGDKYETGRAMMHLEKEKYARQLAHAIQLKEQLSNLNPQLSNAQVEFGALVHTSKGQFYISVGLGKLSVDGQQYFAMSFASPIIQAIKGLKKGDTSLFRGQKIDILEVQ